MSHAKDVARAQRQPFRNNATPIVGKMQEMSEEQKAFIREIEEYLPKAPDDAKDTVAQLLQALKSRTLSKGEMDKIRKVYEASKPTLEKPEEHKMGAIAKAVQNHTKGIVVDTVRKLRKENRLNFKNGKVWYTDKGGITQIDTVEVIAGSIWDKMNAELTAKTMGMGNLATLDISVDFVKEEILKYREG